MRSHIACLAALATLSCARSKPVTQDAPWETGTFSILAMDAETGEIGGAVQSRVFSVGNGVL
jgi:hypothetical protein